MSLLTATGFKILKRSNMLLNKKKSGAFDIQNNNGFIKAQRRIIRIQPLHEDQKKLISTAIMQ